MKESWFSLLDERDRLYSYCATKYIIGFDECKLTEVKVVTSYVLIFPQAVDNVAHGHRCTITLSGYSVIISMEGCSCLAELCSN